MLARPAALWEPRRRTEVGSASIRGQPTERGGQVREGAGGMPVDMYREKIMTPLTTGPNIWVAFYPPARVGPDIDGCMHNCRKPVQWAVLTAIPPHDTV